VLHGSSYSYYSPVNPWISPALRCILYVGGYLPLRIPKSSPQFFAVRNSDDDSHLKKTGASLHFFDARIFHVPMIFPMDFVASHLWSSQGGYLPSHRAARLQRVVRLVASSGAFAALTEGGWAAWRVSFRWVKYTRSDVFQMGYFHNLPRDLSEHLIFQASC
jgi:hypothetical protein